LRDPRNFIKRKQRDVADGGKADSAGEGRGGGGSKRFSALPCATRKNVARADENRDGRFDLKQWFRRAGRFGAVTKGVSESKKDKNPPCVPRPVAAEGGLTRIWRGQRDSEKIGAESGAKWGVAGERERKRPLSALINILK